MIELRQYTTVAGNVPYTEWFTGLKDAKAAARITARLERVVGGNFGDCKPVGEGVSEIRIDYGPGYQIYFAIIGGERLLLLCGGTKRRQSADIARAIEYLKDFKERSVQS